MCYVRARKLSLDEILPYIAKTPEYASRSFWCPNIKRCVFISLATARMRLFGRSQECVACKIQADHFWIEKNSQNPINGWHLNMYALNHHGDPVMLTLDHIKPRSKGGKRNPKNIQLLCRHCNSLKSDLNMPPHEIARRRAVKDVVLRKSLEQAGILPVYQCQSKVS